MKKGNVRVVVALIGTESVHMWRLDKLRVKVGKWRVLLVILMLVMVLLARVSV